ncbi:MAG: hypothetical protein HY868_10160 [Chloroflexi bacterium]|nr:hypothetical protein [Chloroflexota bacterium]
MNARKFFLIAMLFVLAIVAVACATPTPTPMPIPTPIPPTAAPKPTDAPKATEAPKPTVAPTKAAEPTKPPAAAFDVKAALDKYFSALPDGFSTIQPAAVKDQMAATKVFILDLREANEVATDGYIDGSVVISVRSFLKNLDKLPAKDQPIITTCAGGHRGAMAMATLQMLGYTNVKSMAGGIRGWKTANLPVVMTGTPAMPVAGKAPEVDKDLFAAFDKYFSALPDGWGTIQATAAKDQMAATKVTILDVREASEFATGYIEGSLNISIRSLLKSDKLPSDKATPIIATCASGHRGAMAMMALQMLGYTNVKAMVNGINAWKAANLPVVGGAPAAAAFDLKATFDKYFAALPDGFGLIQPAAMKDQMGATKVFVLDMREASEITTNGFVEGAVNIPTRTLMKNLDKLPAKNQPIIVMCGSGVRSPLGMASLQLLGYTNVKSLAGGFGAWKAANLPVATGTPAAPVAGKAPDVDKDLLAALDKWFTALPDGYGGVAPAAAKDQMAATKVTLIDVREASEIASGGKIEGSISIPVRTLIKSLDKLPADKAAPIIVTCASGHRGMFSIMALQMLGYTNVKNISGGVNAWKAANLPVVQ